MKLKMIVIFLCAMALSACSDPYDFAGQYKLTDNTDGDCEPVSGKQQILLGIFPVLNDEGVHQDDMYQASLINTMSGGGLYPIHSTPAQADGGDITFIFFKTGEALIFKKPMVRMVMEIEEEDDDKIIVSSWEVTMSNHPHDPSKSSFSFDFITHPRPFDRVFHFWRDRYAKTNPSKFSNLVGDSDGLCLENVQG